MNGGDLAWSAGESMTNLVAGRLAASGWTAIVDRLRATRQSDSAGGTTEERRQAYAEFRRSVVEYRTTLAMLAAAPPRLVGALWSVPIHLRLLHRSPALASDLLDRFLAVHTVGRSSAVDAADVVVARLSAASDAYVTSVGTRRRGQGASLEAALTQVGESLADFTLEVRRDLGYGEVRSRASGPTVMEEGH